MITNPENHSLLSLLRELLTPWQETAKVVIGIAVFVVVSLFVWQGWSADQRKADNAEVTEQQRVIKVQQFIDEQQKEWKTMKSMLFSAYKDHKQNISLMETRLKKDLNGMDMRLKRIEKSTMK